ncbi:MAG: hypothetical protein GY790_14500 [Bacteroidetes bacterium]|nr:hypothetical protein [Bacteroidota bacterium]
MNGTCIASLLMACVLITPACKNQKQVEDFPFSDFNELLRPVPLHSILEQEDYWDWENG